MEKRTLGKTGLEVSRLGLGLAWIGFELTLNETQQAGEVLNTALDAGVNLLDTAACYGISEELIGRTVAHRRQEYFLATKCGHGGTGVDWSAETVNENIDRSLRRMRTDYLDIVQLHSCGVQILEESDAVQALLDAKKAGKTRFIGHSGDNESARWVIDSGLFDTLQTSFNLIDQRARTQLFPAAEANDIGVIIKRPIANAVWRAAKSPSAYYDDYFERAKTMDAMGPIPGAPEDRILLPMNFTFAHEEVDTAIVGTKNPDNMRQNIELFNSGLSISQEAVADLYRRFDQVGGDWTQLS